MGIQFGSILQCYWIPNSTTRSDLIAVSILNKKMTWSNFICYLIALVHTYIVHLNMVHILFCCMYFFFSLNWLILLKCPTIAIWHARFSSQDVFIDSSRTVAQILLILRVRDLKQSLTNLSWLVFALFFWRWGWIFVWFCD